MDLANTNTEVKSAHGILVSLSVNILFFICQSLLISHFLYRIHKRELSFKIKMSSLSVMLIALLGMFFEILLIIIDLNTNAPSNSIYCLFEIFIRYIWFIIFEVTLYIFWTIRIFHTFKYSILEIPKKYTYVFLSIITAFLIIFLIILGFSIVPSYILLDFTFNPKEYEYGYECTTGWNIGIFIVFMVGQLFTIICNIFLASIFFYKLAMVCISFFQINTNLKNISSTVKKNIK